MGQLLWYRIYRVKKVLLKEKSLEVNRMPVLVIIGTILLLPILVIFDLVKDYM